MSTPFKSSTLQQADAWAAVIGFLKKTDPNWAERPGANGIECALHLLAEMAAAYRSLGPQAKPRRVRKVGGSFQHTGTVVCEFFTTLGEPRVVLEFDAPIRGMLHIYRPDQVEDIHEHS